MVGVSIPSPNVLRDIREGLGLSQTELASALGFRINGDRTVREWETREDFKPTPLAWAAIRYLALAARLYGQMPYGSERNRVAFELPEAMR